MLRPWKWGSLWIFDEFRVGLSKEPFVSDASALIDALVSLNDARPDKEGKINLLFGPKPFRGSIKLNLVEEQPNGACVTYRWLERKMDAWLCPAFFRYFEVGRAPRELFAMAMS